MIDRYIYIYIESVVEVDTGDSVMTLVFCI